MSSFSKSFFLLAACMLVASAPVPTEFQRALPDVSQFTSQEKELINLDVSNFKRLDDRGVAAEGSAFLNSPFTETDIFKRQDDGGLVLPADFKPLPVSSKQFLHLDSSNF